MRSSASLGSTNQNWAAVQRRQAKSQAGLRQTRIRWQLPPWPPRFSIPAARLATWQPRQRRLQQLPPDTDLTLRPRQIADVTTTKTRNTITTLNGARRRRLLRRPEDHLHRKLTRKTRQGSRRRDRRLLCHREPADSTRREVSSGQSLKFRITDVTTERRHSDVGQLPGTRKRRQKRAAAIRNPLGTRQGGVLQSRRHCRLGIRSVLLISAISSEQLLTFRRLYRSTCNIELRPLYTVEQRPKFNLRNQDYKTFYVVTNDSECLE